MIETGLAKAISYLFHPLLMPLYILLLLLNLDAFFLSGLASSYKLTLVGVTFLTTILVPLLLIFLLYKRKLIRSFFMETREERIYPILIIAIFYYLTYYLFKGIRISPVFSYYMLGATFLSILALIITFYRKISLHMLGMGGLSGLILGLGFNLSVNLVYFIVLTIFISGITGFARLKLSSHKASEIYSGYLLGAGVMFLLFYLI
jgi:hypothetical protein